MQARRFVSSRLVDLGRAVIALAFVGCASSSAESTSADSSTCADYGATAPTIVDGGQIAGNLPDCLPRCGAAAVGNFGGSNYLESALPAGTCAGDSSCRMEAWGSCPNGNTSGHGPANGYRCDCVIGQWRCTIESPGGGVGSCGVAPDASAD